MGMRCAAPTSEVCDDRQTSATPAASAPVSTVTSTCVAASSSAATTAATTTIATTTIASGERPSAERREEEEPVAGPSGLGGAATETGARGRPQPETEPDSAEGASCEASRAKLPDLRLRLQPPLPAGDIVHRSVAEREGRLVVEIRPRLSTGASRGVEEVEVKRERSVDSVGEVRPREEEHQATAQDQRIQLQLRALAHAAAADPRGANLVAFPTDRNLQLARRINLQARLSRPTGGGGEVEGALRRRERSDPLLDHRRMTTKERYDAAYETAPGLDRHCDFCGGGRCSRFTKGANVPYCDRYRHQKTKTPTRRICDYRRCETPTDHMTNVCPMLRARCPTCLCRGHLTGCDMSNEDVMTGLREDFDEFALVGVWTRRMERDLAWSWFPYPRGASRIPGQPPVPLQALKHMGTFEAMDYLTGVLSLPANRNYVPPCYDEEAVLD